MRTPIILTRCLALLVLAGLHPIANAQKLPTIQKDAVFAPATVNVDGKANEWDGSFQAYSNSTDLFYTIANNNENLYLVINADYHVAIQKIVAGGITFSIISADKKHPAVPVTITYPIMTSFSSQGSTSLILRGNTTDAELSEMNKNFTVHTKELPVTGIKDITDKSISIYNELGIKAAQYVDEKKTYTFEMSIPLKYLKDVIDNKGAFSYKIQVNGLNSSGGHNIIAGSSLDPSDAPVTRGSANYLFAPTYLTGTYTLAKK